MNRIPVLIIFLSVCFGLAHSQTSLDQQYAAALSQFESHHYAEAKDAFETLIPQAPTEYKRNCVIYLLKSCYHLGDHAIVEQKFNAYKDIVLNTPQAPDAQLIMANSLADNAHDYAGAAVQYEGIASQYPASSAAPAALLKAGVLQTQKLNDIPAGLANLRKAVGDYPQSVQAPEALVEIMQAHALLKQRDVMEMIRAELDQKYPDSLELGRAAFVLGDFCYAVERNRADAITYFKECYEGFPDCKPAPLAKIRTADLYPKNRAGISIKLYEELLEAQPNVGAKLYDWAHVELGFAYWLKNNTEAARSQFETVTSNEQSYPPFKAKAQAYLNALDNPNSTAAADIYFDLAFRHRDYLKELDRANNHYARIINLWNAGVFEAPMADAATTDSKKAEWLYELSIAHYFTGYPDKAYQISTRILKEFPNETYYTQHAAFSIAYINCSSGDYAKAINQYMKILDQNPTTIIATRVMGEIGRCQLQSGKVDEAMMTFDGLQYLYPWHFEGNKAGQMINFIIKGRSDLQEQYQQISLIKNPDKLKQTLSEWKQKPIPAGYKSRFYQLIQKMELAQSGKPPTQDSLTPDSRISMLIPE